MLTRVNKVLIGKDINRDAQVVPGASLKTITLSTGLADGEVVVLDKYKRVLAPGSTFADSDTIYICQATSETFSYTNEEGTSVTGARKVRMSDPINGKYVKSFKARSYSAKAEQASSVTLTGMTPAAGTEYIVRIIYKDVEEYPGQFTQTYRHVATAATATSVATLCAALVAKINSHKGRRVVATDNTTGITITGLPIPECTTSVNDIDEFKQVQFEVKFLYVTSSGNWATMPSTSTAVTTTGPTPGVGTWEQVRDLEKNSLSNIGITNKTQFPVIKPDMTVVKDSCYDLIVIEHDREYLSPGLNNKQRTPLTTVIALATASDGVNTGTQAADIVAQLNPWFESLGFSSISI